MLLALMLASCGDPPPAHQDGKSRSRPPNILLLLADDLGNHDLGINRERSGGGSSPTPNLDDLAQAGTRFTRFYTESTCSPSRAALLTGRYAARSGFRPVARGIPPELTTLPEALRAQGYATHHVGKWHLGSTRESAWPLAQGFDSSFGFLNQWSLREPSDKQPVSYPTYFDPWLKRNNEPAVPFKGHLTDLLTDHTSKLIETADATQPWFIYHAYFAPHTPIEPASRFAANFPDTHAGRYEALLQQLDESAGRILESLRASGQYDNTIIVLASDNGGPNKARDNNAPYFGKKSTYWEGGVRVPLVIHWPQGFQPGTEIREAVTIFDLYPTLLGLVSDDDIPPELDGVDLAVALEEQTSERAGLDRDLFWESFVYNHVVYGVLDRNNQRLYHELNNETHLLDLTENPHGDPTRSIEDPVTVDALRAKYRDWRSDTRELDLEWESSSVDGHGVLSGDDFQRAPGVAGYTFSIGITPAADGAASGETQFIAEQSGLLTVALDETRRVVVEVDGETLRSSPIEPGRCHSIVFSAFFHRQTTPNAIKNRLKPMLGLFVDGLGADLVQSERRVPGNEDLSQPTFIGRDAQGNRQFEGKLSAPHIYNQMLLLEETPSFAGIDGIHSRVCPNESAPTST